MLLTSPLALLLEVSGTNFGTLANAQRDGWTAAEQAVSLGVDGSDCAGAVRGQQGSLPVIECTIPLLPAGPHNVSISVAGQNTTLPSSNANALVVACNAGYYGAIGQFCLPCPVGATCAGYRATLVPPAARFVDPVPSAGFFDLNGSMLTACPALLVIPGRSSCIVPCVPAAACLGENACATGYVSKAPYYRCASCATGYYQLGSTCAQCPSSPLALIIGIAMAFIGVAILGYILNKRGVNVGYISIGVDWAQVVAIFADAGVQWPPAVLQLLHILSAFNLNLEIVAPECLVPSVSFTQKFSAVMLIPVVVGLMFTVVGAVSLAYKRCVLGRQKNLTRHLGTLISSLMLIAYFLYIYITRLLLDVFNCAPTDPPDGKLYLQVVFEECGIPGGTQMTLMPWAILGVIFYTVGYPAYLAQLLWRNREIVMTDQLLRAKGSGLDRLTNPVAYDFRRKYGRSYYQFKPDFAPFWILFVFARKLGIASVGVIFNRNVAFQMAAALLVMFIAYALQVRYSPYMGPGDFEEALASHTASALVSARHARIRSTLANIATSGKKRMRRNLLNHEGKIDRKAVLSVLTSYMFSYNTVESTLLFSAIMVCLMGLMYTAQTSQGMTYASTTTIITAVLMVDLVGTILYFMTVLLVEIFIMYTEAQRAREMAAAQKAGESRRKNTPMSSKSAQESVVIGPVDSSLNPMFMSKGGNGSSANPLLAGGQAARDAVLALTSPPPPELWSVFQTQFLSFSEQVEQLASQIASAKAMLQRMEMQGTNDGTSDMTVYKGTGLRHGASSRIKTQFGQVATADDVNEGGAVVPSARPRSGTLSSQRLLRAGSIRGRNNSGESPANASKTHPINPVMEAPHDPPEVVVNPLAGDT